MCPASQASLRPGRPYRQTRPNLLGLGELQIGSGFFAALGHHVVADLLIVIEAAQPGLPEPP